MAPLAAGWFTPVDPFGSPAARWSTVARIAAAAALVTGALLQLVSFILEPATETAAERIAWIRANPDVAPWVKVADVAAMPFLLAGALVHLALARERSPRLAYTAAGLTATGLVGLTAIQGTEVLLFALAATPGQDATVLANVIDGDLSPGMAAALLVFIPPAMIGLILTTIALWRSRALPRIAVLLIPAFVVTDFALDMGLLGHAIAFAGAAWIALVVLTAPRADRATAPDVDVAVH